jgi:hypothetical protein|tara:strand:+ start:2763 stop:3488 length:726 start_codon:yes stop_codon:yes gene_type:complete
MNKLKIKFTKPPGAINSLTAQQVVVDKFEDWDLIPDPMPATKMVPDWFKQTKPLGGPIDTMPTIKKCPPFIDAITSGYIINFCSTINVKRITEGQISKTGKGTMFMSSHAIGQFENAPWYGKPVLKFASPWIIETPPGWSCFFTHPLNVPNDQYHMLSGIVDTDSYRVPVNFPFIMNTPLGGEINFDTKTPMVQVIPFKRQDWEMEVGITDWDEWKGHQNVLGKSGDEAYKKNFHVKKKFT